MTCSDCQSPLTADCVRHWQALCQLYGVQPTGEGWTCPQCSAKVARGPQKAAVGCGK